MIGKKIVALLLTLIAFSIFAVAYSTSKIASTLPVKNVTRQRYYATIQDAINATETLDGDTITVEAGTYDENLRIFKSLIIIGHGQNQTIVNANSDFGISISAANVKIEKLTVQNARVGVYTDGSGTGLSEVLVRKCNSYGIQVNGKECEVSRSIVTDVAKTPISTGITIDQNASLEENTVTNCTFGIWITRESNCSCRLTGNDMRNNTYNLLVDDLHGTHAIDSSNKVDGKPVYYLVNKHDEIIAGSDVGFVKLVNCSNITMRGLNLTKNGSGIDIVNSTFCEISSCFVAQNFYGITIFNSSTTIYENRINSNNYGVSINSVERLSKVFHNMFLDNEVAATGRAIWDDGYPSGGNFWSDYSLKNPNPRDDKSGPYQNLTGSDGIWDRPYYGDEGLVMDSYPLVYPPGTTARFGVSWNQKSYTVNVFSDSMVSGFSFDGPTQEIVFTATGGTFCNVTVPRGLADGAFAVHVDDELVRTELGWNETFISVCFNDDLAGMHAIRLTAEYVGRTPLSIDFPDITGPQLGVPDGEINILDISLVARHFGETR